MLLKSATIIDPESAFHRKTVDILIRDGKLARIAPFIEDIDEPLVELPNLHVSQGWMDCSVCMGEPGFEERDTIENTLKTAAKSGFTDVVMQPYTYPVPDTHAAISFLKTKSAGNPVNLYPVGALTQASEGVRLSELYDLKNAGAAAFGDYKKPLSNAGLLITALRYAQLFQGVVCSFPHQPQVAPNAMVNEHIAATALGLKGIPPLAEELQVMRDIAILGYTGGSLHIPTISTATSVALIREAKARGLALTCSVAIPNLFFTDEVLQDFDTSFKLMPPLRTQIDVDALLVGLEDGVIDFVTCDHNPIDIEHKKTVFEEALYGAVGLESAFGALNSLLGTEKTVHLLTRNKAYFGATNHSVCEGEKACLSLFAPDMVYTFGEEHLSSFSKNSPFPGKTLKGKAYGIVNNHQLIIHTT